MRGESIGEVLFFTLLNRQAYRHGNELYGFNTLGRCAVVETETEYGILKSEDEKLRWR